MVGNDRPDGSARTEGRRWWHRPWVAWAAFVVAGIVNVVAVYSPSQPGPSVSVGGADKVVHLVLFALVAWTGRRAGLRPALLGGVLVLHAVSSELVQGTLLPDRSGDWHDVLADVAGTALGLGLAWVRDEVRRRTGR